jgi:arylsulfatase A-like enzyme
MVRTKEWKYVHWEGFRGQLFDLTRDPQELVDLGADAGYEPVRQAMRERLLDRLATLRHRITVADAEIAEFTDTHRARGIDIGIY